MTLAVRCRESSSPYVYNDKNGRSSWACLPMGRNYLRYSDATVSLLSFDLPTNSALGVLENIHQILPWRVGLKQSPLPRTTPQAQRAAAPRPTRSRTGKRCMIGRQRQKDTPIAPSPYHSLVPSKHLITSPPCIPNPYSHPHTTMASTTSTTTQIETAPPPQSRTIRLPSGQTVTPNSEVSIISDEIPIIDVSCVWSNDLDAKKAVAEQVREASHRIGFFYAKYHVRPSSPDRCFMECYLLFESRGRGGSKLCVHP